MRRALLIFAAGTMAVAANLPTTEPPPRWWPYVPPDSPTLAGIRWDRLRHSPLAPALEDQIAPGGSLEFPRLECLSQTREWVISSAPLLAVATGAFPEQEVRDQAERAGLLGVVYRGVNLWVPKQADVPGIAQIADDLLLVGAEAALRAALDRSAGAMNRPLAARLARLSGNPDLWVVADTLPNPLVDWVVPIDAAGAEFAGQISLEHGFVLAASFDALSAESAALFAHDWPERIVPVGGSGQELNVTAQAGQVTIDLRAATALTRLIELAVAPQPGSGAPDASGGEYKFEVTHTESSQPRIVRIFNLEEGTREILLHTVH